MNISKTPFSNHQSNPTDDPFQPAASNTRQWTYSIVPTNNHHHHAQGMRNTVFPRNYSRSYYPYSVAVPNQLSFPRGGNHFIWQTASGINSFFRTQPLRRIEPFLAEMNFISERKKSSDYPRLLDGYYHEKFSNTLVNIFESNPTKLSTDEKYALICAMNEWLELMPMWSLGNLVHVASNLNRINLLVPITQIETQARDRNFFSHLLKCANDQCTLLSPEDCISNITRLLHVITVAMARKLQPTSKDFASIDSLWKYLTDSGRTIPGTRTDYLIWSLAWTVLRKRTVLGKTQLRHMDINYAELLLTSINQTMSWITSPDDLTKVIWACAILIKHGVNNQKCIEVAYLLLPKIIGCIKKLDQRNIITDLLWAVSYLGIVSGESAAIFKLLIRPISSVNLEFFQQKQILWAYTVWYSQLNNPEDKKIISTFILTLMAKMRSTSEKYSIKSDNKYQHIMHIAHFMLDCRCSKQYYPQYPRILSAPVVDSLAKQLNQDFPGNVLVRNFSRNNFEPVTLAFLEKGVLIDCLKVGSYPDPAIIKTGHRILKETCYRKLGFQLIQVTLDNFISKDLENYTNLKRQVTELFQSDKNAACTGAQT